MERFNALSGNNNISVCTDRTTYQKVALAPESQRPKRVNIRYLLSPIETKGRFHPKLYLFTTKSSGRLIVGSCNFTRPGLTSNAELADLFDFEAEEQAGNLPIFQDAFAFIDALAEGWPLESFASNVRELWHSTPWLRQTPAPESRTVRLLHNLEQPLWSQIVAIVPQPIEYVHVVSRFFDDTPVLIDRVMQEFRPAKLFLYTQNGVTTMTRHWLDHDCVKCSRAEILLCAYDDEGHQQPLHAKAIIFESGNTRTLVYGSANFTSPALLSHGRSGNIETVIVVPDVPEKALDPRRFCDPCGSAYHLRSPEQLQSAPREQEEHPPVMPIHLIEAVLAEHTLMVRACLPAHFDVSHLAARLHLEGSRGLVLPITRMSEERFSIKVPERVTVRLQESSTLVSLESFDQHHQLSNLVFVTNLLDIKTQNSVRRERHIREATESAGQFFSVLNDLLRAADNTALLTFLNFCDIPLVNAPRPPALRNRPVWQGQDGMRHLGERNLQMCKTLHEATLNFFERHLRKLKRHTESLSLDSIANFLQIFLSMGSLLRMQIERLVIALEARPTDVPAQKWWECRELWDVYFLKFRELMECLWDEYLRPLSADCSRHDLSQEFGQDLDAIHELCDGMVQYRARIETVRRDKCVRRNFDGRKIPFGYFQSILEPTSWRRYTEAIQQRQSQIDGAVLGQSKHVLPAVNRDLLRPTI
ncbi:MAG TPA: hypothetical protein VFW94_10855 [Candidatus Acidoferrales bacterium]|nr:hypothetical protein [Candidatus Acidoferrales bacterium]